MKYAHVPVACCTSINEHYFSLCIEHPEMAKCAVPGQFFQIKDSLQNFPLLPRPFSVSNVTGSKISFLIKKIGTATNHLASLSAGDSLDVLGPLGNGFLLNDYHSALIVSGGIGYAPFPFLKKILAEKQIQYIHLHGGRSAEDCFPDADGYFTEDGSYGQQGFVTKGLESCIATNRYDVIYACGPEAMLQSVVRCTKHLPLSIQLSMESRMACGIGSCCGCVISIKEKDKLIYKKVCKDGPVFEGRTVVWDE